jgi:hypothetical protein
MVLFLAGVVSFGVSFLFARMFRKSYQERMNEVRAITMSNMSSFVFLELAMALVFFAGGALDLQKGKLVGLPMVFYAIKIVAATQLVWLILDLLLYVNHLRQIKKQSK